MKKEEKKKKIPLLHKTLARSFIEHVETENTIPYSKVKFVLRFKFRVPKDKYLEILGEFCDYGLLEKESNSYYKIKNIDKINEI